MTKIILIFIFMLSFIFANNRQNLEMPHFVKNDKEFLHFGFSKNMTIFEFEDHIKELRNKSQYDIICQYDKAKILKGSSKINHKYLLIDKMNHLNFNIDIIFENDSLSIFNINLNMKWEK